MTCVLDIARVNVPADREVVGGERARGGHLLRREVQLRG